MLCDMNNILRNRNALYDDVSIHLFDHLQYIQFALLNLDNLLWKVVNNTYLVADHGNSKYDMIRPPEIYVSVRWYNKKCFTINIPFVDDKRIWKMTLNLNNSIFQDKILLIREMMSLSMHHPFQLMRSFLRSTASWESTIYRNDCFNLQVSVESIDVVKRRNKYQEPCNSDLRGHDNITLARMLAYVGCAPAHWNTESLLPKCNTQKQYLKANWFYQDFEEEMPPCQSIERLIKTLSARSCKIMPDTNFFLDFVFHDPVYKEINVLRAYGFQSLVGNAGKNHRLLIATYLT